jgi:hypothetical protein
MFVFHLTHMLLMHNYLNLGHVNFGGVSSFYNEFYKRIQLWNAILLVDVS